MLDARSAQGKLNGAVLKLAAESTDAQFRADALARLAPASSLDGNKVHELFNKKLEDRIVRSLSGRGDATYKRIATLVRAGELAKDHPEYTGYIDAQSIKQGLQTLLHDDVSVQRSMRAMHDAAANEVKQSVWYRSQVEMLKSPEFLYRLNLEGAAATDTVQQELGKVAAVDPKMAEELSNRFVGLILANEFYALSGNAQAEALAGAIDHRLRAMGINDAATFEKRVKSGEVPASALTRIADRMRALNSEVTAEAIQSGGDVTELASAIEEAGGLNRADKSALAKVFKLDAAGAIQVPSFAREFSWANDGGSGRFSPSWRRCRAGSPSRTERPTRPTRSRFWSDSRRASRRSRRCFRLATAHSRARAMRAPTTRRATASSVRAGVLPTSSASTRSARVYQTQPTARWMWASLDSSVFTFV